MTEEELKAIEARMNKERFVLMVEVEALIAEVRRLKARLKELEDGLQLIG